MKASITGFLIIGLAVTSLVAQQAEFSAKDAQIAAIVNLRKLAMAESTFAMRHPTVGFACDANVLTKLEWPNSPKHVRLVDPALLVGTGQYRFSVRCVDGSSPAGKLNVSAEPLDQRSGLPTFCAMGTFEAIPYRHTSEFPIRKITNGTAENCLSSGKPLH